MGGDLILDEQAIELKQLVLGDNVSESDWEPYPSFDKKLCHGLLKWVLSRDPDDCAVPDPVTNLLAKVFCECANVVFGASSGEYSSSSPHWQYMKEGDGYICHLQARGLFRLWEKPISFLCTQKTDVAVWLFDTIGYPWTQHGQMVFLFPKQAKPPHVLNYRQMDHLLLHKTYIDANLIRDLGVKAIIAPCHDGYLAHFMCSDTAFWNQLKQTFAKICQEQGVEWKVVAGREFDLIPFYLR